MFDQSGGWKPKLCTKSFFGLARMFQNPHAFASSTVFQKVAAHRGSLSIGAVVAAGIGVIAWMI
jgi:ABC-type branched-subunit amino acid transport system ATPase component